MFYPNNNTPTLLPQTLSWGSFRANDNRQPTLIFSNTLKLNFTGLTENTTYNWTTKVQKGMANATAIDLGNFTTGAGETTHSLNIYLTAGLYNVGCTYYFGLAEAVQGGEEGIQFDFKIDNRVTLDTNGGVISGQLINQAFSYSGEAFSVSTNRFLDEKSLELNNITVFTNAKIPTTLAVQTYVNARITNFDLDLNTDFTDLKGRVSTNEDDILDLQTNKRDISSSYSRTEIDTKDTNTLTSANNYTDQEVGDLVIATNNALNGKEPTITAGTTAQYFRGDKTFQTLDTSAVPENSNLYFTAGRVLNLALTGFNTALTGAITATDTILQAFGKVQNALDSKVNNTGNETINGVKTFGSIPVLPNSNPITTNQATRKSYVDGLDSQNVKTTGDQTVAGTKTFSSPLGVPSPLADGDAVNRLYTSNIQARVITETIAMFKQKVETDGLVLETWRLQGVVEELSAVLASCRVLPPLFFSRFVSCYPSQPNRIYNIGTSSNAFALMNGTLTGVYSEPDYWLFNGTDNWISTSRALNANTLLVTQFNTSVSAVARYLWCSSQGNLNDLQTNLINNRNSVIQSGIATYTGTQTYTDNIDNLSIIKVQGTSLDLAFNSLNFENFTINAIPTAGRTWQFGVRGTNQGFYSGKVKRLMIFDENIANNQTKIFAKSLAKQLI